jgi:hypothetical protein
MVEGYVGTTACKRQLAEPSYRIVSLTHWQGDVKYACNNFPGGLWSHWMSIFATVQQRCERIGTPSANPCHHRSLRITFPHWPPVLHSPPLQDSMSRKKRHDDAHRHEMSRYLRTS